MLAALALSERAGDGAPGFDPARTTVTGTARRSRADEPTPTRCAERTQEDLVFLFFSNRVGCLGSLLVSAALTVVLFLVLSR